ncbi:MAG: scyllo-inositol 2-dehydrogenase (NAD(+)) [Nitrosomonadaceae bacterium]|nr:scyllo-inositol 2-dehydrogenase (NAD(+)) [Nitrosomonadaceae bacterium]
MIVGLGKISMGYDLTLPTDSSVYSHARVLILHPDFELCCAVDLDESKRATFGRVYKAPAYPALGQALKNHRVDLAVIATPTETHYGEVHQLLALGRPKALLCEKPLSNNLNDSRARLSCCEKRVVSLYVNYMRRSEPGVIEVKRRIESGEIASPLNGRKEPLLEEQELRAFARRSIFARCDIAAGERLSQGIEKSRLAIDSRHLQPGFDEMRMPSLSRPVYS